VHRNLEAGAATPNPGSKSTPKACPTRKQAMSPARQAEGLRADQDRRRGGSWLSSHIPTGPGLRHPTQLLTIYPQREANRAKHTLPAHGMTMHILTKTTAGQFKRQGSPQPYEHSNDTELAHANSGTECRWARRCPQAQNYPPNARMQATTLMISL